MTGNSKHFLIVGPSWVGDMVMAQSLFIDLKRRQPNATIDVLAPAWTAALIDRMPQVRQLIEANFEHGKLSLAERYKVGKALRKMAYTHAIILPNSIKSALVPAIAKIPVRTGFVGEQRWGLLNDIRRLNKTVLPMTVQRFVSLGLALDTPAPSVDSIPAPQLNVDAQSLNQVREKFSLSKSGSILALCPGAEFGASKQWPIKYYAELATHFLDKGWQVYLMGSDKDVSDCNEINQLADGQCLVLAGKTSLPEAVDVLSLANLVVSNDSGLMHIAAALQIPLVAVYGSTDPQHTPPLSINHAIVKLDLECSPCFKRECPLNHHNCMQNLTPQSVIARSESLL